MKKILTAVLALAMVSIAGSISLAEEDSYMISAEIPDTSAFNVKIFRIVPVDGGEDDWDDTPSNGVHFGGLRWDTENSIFVGQQYYAVEVGIVDNTGNNWTLQHSGTPIANGGANLDQNVNVTFMKQLSGTSAVEIAKLTYDDANNHNITKNQVKSGGGQWLRIYYGIATGNTNPVNGEVDAPNALPIGDEKPAGTYRGTVTLTLTP